MEFSDFIVKNSYGEVTLLDKEYKKLINNVIVNSTEEDEIRWGTYNLIIKEMIKLNDYQYFEEIKYRLTDGENPNEVLIDIISRYKPENLNHLILFLMNRVEEYAEEDFLKRFY
jgi:hypothetical protein